ncbi:MAG: RNA methyltransferase, partial [Alistipes sp.]|nr:RNA methyltransferase [Alistipes sp.]
DAAGADGVIIPKRRSASLTPAVYKTSAGAASAVKVARVPNLAACIRDLKEEGVWIYGAEMDGERYDRVDMRGAAALVIGSEGRGLSRVVKEACDFLVTIPMNGQVNSLNASVAAGVLMYDAVGCVKYLLAEPSLVRLLVEIGVGAVVYLGLAWLFRFEALTELRQLIRKKKVV